MVEDIRRKTALRENKLVLWASYGVVIVLLAVFCLSTMKIKGFQIGDYATVFILLTMFGNCFLLIFASNKQNKLSANTTKKRSEPQLNRLFILLVLIGVVIMGVSQMPWLVPTAKSLLVLVISGGFIVGLIFIWQVLFSLQPLLKIAIYQRC